MRLCACFACGALHRYRYGTGTGAGAGAGAGRYRDYCVLTLFVVGHATMTYESRGGPVAVRAVLGESVYVSSGPTDAPIV